MKAAPVRATLRTAIALMVLVGGPLTSVASAREVRGSSPLSVVITSPPEGAVVTGDVQIAAHASEGTTEVRFAVSTDGGTTWTPIGTDDTAADGWTATWQTGGYSGPAIVRAVATDGASEASDHSSVTVDNSAPVASVRVSLDVFSPNADGRKDKTVLEAFSNEPAWQTLEVLDGDGIVRRSWTTATMATKLAAEWNGRADGQRLPDGGYTVRATAVDGAGLTASASEAVVGDTRPPRIRSLRIGPRIFTRAGVLVADYRLRDRATELVATLKIADRIGVFARRTRRGGSAGEIRYRTRYRNGDVLYPGLYTARVRVRDDAGNVRKSRATRWRMRRPVTARVFKRLNGVGRLVALTFDDCNSVPPWNRILSTLAAGNVEATFFCSGAQIRGAGEIVRRTVRRGHAIGAHGWDHAVLAGRSRSDTEWRIRSDDRLWWEMARDTTAPLYRPAYGAYDRNVLAGAGATGHGRVIMWDVDSLDWATSSPGVIAGRVLAEVRPGSIVLLHVLDRTASALPAILRGLSQKNLRPVDLHTFLRAGGYR
ncbi:MAG: polysaccharide deacetylase family protein [Actinomycetota bacterium]